MEGTLMLEKAFRYLKSNTQKITRAFMIFNSIDMPLNSKFNRGLPRNVFLTVSQ